MNVVRVVPFPSGEIAVAWDDGHESYISSLALRCACACASCIDEVSGRKILRDEAVPADVAPLDLRPVGRYGFSVRWSDGHDTGIYSHARLRSLCPCQECGGDGSKRA